MGYRRVAAYTKRYEWNDEFFAGGTGDNGYLFTGDRKSTRLNSSHSGQSRMPSSA